MNAEQAEKFLKAHGLKFRAVYLTYAPYFADDKESRNIYRLTISGKNRGRYSTRFGQSLYNTAKNAEPSAYNLLSCLTKYDPGTFEDFCWEYGYDEDSRKALKTYRAVANDWRKVQRFFTAEELEELQDIN